jgi:hypothetical protein
MGKVADDDALVVGIVTLESYTVTAGAAGIQNRRVVYADVDLVAPDLIETIVLGRALVHIGHVAVGRVTDLVDMSISYHLTRWFPGLRSEQ